MKHNFEVAYTFYDSITNPSGGVVVKQPLSEFVSLMTTAHNVPAVQYLVEYDLHVTLPPDHIDTVEQTSVLLQVPVTGLSP